MNCFVAVARLCKDPEVRYGGANNTAIASFDIAIDRRFKKDGQPTADFFRVKCFSKLAEFTEKYLRKGTKIVLQGEVQNKNYKNRDGNMVYSTQIVANSIEFAESKKNAENKTNVNENDGFVDIPDDDINEDFIPFK